MILLISQKIQILIRKLKNLSKKITSNKVKHVIIENEFKKLQMCFKSFYWSKLLF